MSYIGGGMYYAEPCPLCGETLWNGRCEEHDRSANCKDSVCGYYE